MRRLIKLASAILTASLLTACGGDSSNSNSDKAPATGQIKNVIMMVLDDMGPQQVGLLENT